VPPADVAARFRLCAFRAWSLRCSTIARVLDRSQATSVHMVAGASLTDLVIFLDKLANFVSPTAECVATLAF
jgi:hypothetical protein